MPRSYNMKSDTVQGALDPLRLGRRFLTKLKVFLNVKSLLEVSVVKLSYTVIRGATLSRNPNEGGRTLLFKMGGFSSV